MDDRPDLSPAAQRARARLLFEQSARLAAAGLLDPDQPTLGATVADRTRAEAEFTPVERAQIRYLLGLVGTDG